VITTRLWAQRPVPPFSSAPRELPGSDVNAPAADLSACADGRADRGITERLGCRKGTLARQIDLIWSVSMAKIYAAVDKQNGGSLRVRH
jgi:hypothetical protein